MTHGARAALLAVALAPALACAAGPGTAGSPPRDPAVSPAVRGVVEALRPELQRLAEPATMTVAVVAAGRLVWTEGFGRMPGGTAAPADARYGLHALTDLVASAAVLRATRPGIARPLETDRLPPPGEWSCETLAPLWGDDGLAGSWPAPAEALLVRARAVGVERSGGCGGWRASAPELARIGAALMDGVTLGDRETTWLLHGEAVRLAVAAGDGGSAALLVDRSSNTAIAVMTDWQDPGAAAVVTAAARSIHAGLLQGLAPPPERARR